MSLAAGTRLGPYEVLGLIGSGGMGEVYKGRDTRLDRTVAIKVLPPGLATDPDRRRRFEHEARAVAALDHPHICALYDVGSQDTVEFLVMAYLDGETLAQRLTRGPLPVAQALELGAQIADALAAAHRQHIVHRDLKPGNIMVVKVGAALHAKLLDFGLAKLAAHGERPALAGGASVPTQAAPVTAEGTILGTLQYMAPEQLEGKEADARTDLWALGAILYEMVTGRRAFEGESQVSLIGNIMNAEPAALATLQPLTPPALDRVVAKCLAKHPDDRWDTAHDVADELRWISQTSGAGAVADTHGRRRTRRYGVAAAAVVMAVLAATAWFWRFGERHELPPPRLVHLTSTPGSEQLPALSPDGRQVAFRWNGEDRKNWDIYVKLVGETNALRLTTDPLPDTDPCWSPDGARIAFRRRGTDGRSAILTMSPLGGAEQKLVDLPNLASGMSWSPDGKWLAVARDRPSAASQDNSAGIYVQPLSGGDPVRVTSPRSPFGDLFPKYSPDGRSLAFIRSRGANYVSAVFIQSLTRDGTPAGDPRQITHNGNVLYGFAWHPDGKSIIFGEQTAFLLEYLYRASLDGRSPPERIELAGDLATYPSTSAGINRLAFQYTNANWEIWRVRPGGAPEPVIRESFADWSPQLSPDGRRVAFTSNRNGESAEIWTADANGTNPTQLTHGPGRNQGTATWSPDGRWIAFDSQGTDGTVDIYVIESSGGQPRRLTSEPSNESIPSWSRDGRWIYFRSDRTGRAEIWRAPSSGGQWEQMTNAGADASVESADGQTLFYTRTTQELFAKPLGGGAEQRLVDYVVWSTNALAAVPGGIYYWGRAGKDGLYPLLFFDLSSRKSAEITRVANPGPGLSASPDRKSVLYVQSRGSGTDLMLIENFH